MTHFLFLAEIVGLFGSAAIIPTGGNFIPIGVAASDCHGARGDLGRLCVRSASASRIYCSGPASVICDSEAELVRMRLIKARAWFSRKLS